MKYIFILLLSLISINCFSQYNVNNRDFLLKKRDIVPITCSILGGLSNGINRAYYSTNGTCFEKRFNSNPQSFWGSEGWKRKYKNYDEGKTAPRYLGSNTFLSFTTNAPAFTNLSNKGFVFLGTVTITINRKDDFLNHFHRFLLNGMIYGITSYYSYSYLTKYK
jgi:hypothetical protein